MSEVLAVLGAVSLLIGIMIGILTLSDRFGRWRRQREQALNEASYYDSLGDKR